MSKRWFELVLVASVIASILPLTGGSTGAGPASISRLPTYFVSMEVPDPIVVQTFIKGSAYSTLTFDGALSVPRMGSPDLPYLSHPLKIDRKVSHLTLDRADAIAIDLPAPVVPSAGMVRIGAPAADVTFEPYDMGSSYPSEPFSYSYVGSTWEEGVEYHHYSVAACPFDYDPSSGHLTVYRQMEVGIVDYPVSMPMKVPTKAIAPPASLREGTVLLIISADPFVDDLESYRQWSMEKGQMATLVQFSTVDSTYPALDGPSSIWQYVHDSYFASGSKLKYVLLVGELGGVPSRMVKDLNPFMGEPANLPADTYYACLGSPSSGPTLWNADGDGNWGEQGDVQDYLADVYVSRIAVSSDSAAAAWSQKVINYELKPVTGGWGGRAGLFGSETHQTNDGAIQCNYLWSNYLADVYSIKDAYYTNGVGGSKDLTYTNIRDGLDNGLSIVVYMGHGYVDTWSSGQQDVAVWIFGTDVASQLGQGTKLPYITAMSCETNWFDSSIEAISEGFTENPSGGAIAYVGASRTTYGGIGYDQYLPGAPGIQEDVLRMISDNSRPRYRTAEIFMEAKNYYATAWASWFAGDPEMAYNAWMEHNLLGPPDTPIWTSDPKIMTVEYDYNADYYTNFTVTAKGPGGVALPGATVTIYSVDKDKVSSGTTDSNGYAKVPFVIDGPQSGFLTVTLKGYKPYQASLGLQDTTIPVTTVKTRTSKPDGANGWFVGDPELTFVVSESSTTYYKWNGGNKATFKGGEITVPVGQNTLTYWSEDLSGNKENSRTFKIDYDPDAPVLSYEMTPKAPDGNKGWFIHQPVLTLTMESSPGSAQYSEYWWDSGSKVRCNGTIFAMQGEHVLHLRSADEAGNFGGTIDIPLKVDSVAPRTAFFNGGVTQNDAGWYTEPFTITLKCDDIYGTIYYRWDDGIYTRYSSALTPMEGEHVLYYYSSDQNGNKEAEVSKVIDYDATAPITSFSISPSAPDGEEDYYVTKPSLSISSNEPGSSVMYNLDRAGFKEYIGSLKLQDGEHFVEAYAFDPAGNTGDHMTMSIKVDSQPDKVEFSVSPSPTPSGWYSQRPSVRLTTTTGSSIFYSWEGVSSFAEYKGNLLPPVEEGFVSLIFYSEDRAGNRGGQSRLEFSVDAKAPKAYLNVTSSLSPDEMGTFDMSGSHDGIGVTGYWIDFGDGTDPQWHDGPIVEHSYSKAGTYHVQAKAVDQAGHESSVVEGTIVVEDPTSSLVLIAVVIGAAVLILVVVVLGLLLLSHRSDQRHRHHPSPRPVHPQHHPGHPTHPSHYQSHSVSGPLMPAHHVGHMAAHQHAALKRQPTAPAPALARSSQAPTQPAHAHTRTQPVLQIPVPPRPPAAPSPSAEFRVPEPPKPPSFQQ